MSKSLESMMMMAVARHESEIQIYGAIGNVADPGEPFVTSDQVMARLDSVSGDLSVRINSQGGSILEGIAMYNALLRYKKKNGKLTVYVDGFAASIATYIMLAADRVYIAKNAALMVHSPYDQFGGSSEELRSKADTLDRFKSTMVAAYVAKTGMDESKVIELLSADTWLSADEALEMGFVDGIIDHEMHAGAMEWAAAKIDTLGNVPANIANAIKGAVKMNLAQKKAEEAKKAAQAKTETKATAAVENTVENEAPTVVTEDAPVVVEIADELVDELIDAVESGDITPEDVTIITEVIEEVTLEGLEGEERREEIVARLASRRSAQPTTQAASSSASPVARTRHAPRAAALPTQRGVPRQYGVAPKAQVTQKADPREKRIMGMRMALIERAGLPVPAGMANNSGNAFRGLTMTELAGECLRAHGINPRDFRSKDEMIGRAMSFRSHITHATSDFSSVLDGLITVSLGKGFADNSEEVWSEWVDDNYPLPDFNEHSVANIGPYFGVEKVPEGASYTYGTFGASKNPIRIYKYGSIFSVTRELIKSDHLGILTRSGAAMGEAIREAQGDEVADLLISNPTIGGEAVFNATRGNLATGAQSKLSMEAIKKAFLYYRKMRDSVEIAGEKVTKRRSGRPEFLIVPAALEWLARELVEEPKYYDGANEKNNPMYGRLKVVVEDRLDDDSAYSWYLAPAKNRDGLAMGTLDGIKTPYTEQENGFDIDGIKYKIRYDFGAAIIEPRLLYKGVGQA